MPNLAAAFRCCLPFRWGSGVAPAPAQTVVAGNLDCVDNSPHPASAETHPTGIRMFKIPRDVLRQRARDSTDATIERIRSMIMSRESVPLEQWQSAFDMLIANLELFRAPEGMGLPARDRAAFEALFARPVAAGEPLREIVDLLGSGVPVFDGATVRAELAEFIGHVDRALGREPVIQRWQIPLEALRSAGWERCSEVTGTLASLAWRDDVTVEQWREAIDALIACLEFLRDATPDGMGMPLWTRDYANRLLETLPAMNGLPLRRVPGHVHELLQPASRETLREFLFNVACLLGDHAIDVGDLDRLAVLHANHAFPHDARKAVGR